MAGFGRYKIHYPMFIIHIVCFLLCIGCGIFLILYSHFLSASLTLLDHIRHDPDIYVIDPILREDDAQKASTKSLRDAMLAAGIIAVALSLILLFNIIIFLSLMVGPDSSLPSMCPPFGRLRDRVVEEAEYIEYYDY